ncbi:MAG: MaoC family dehydratase N-terminal domain-containing protein [Chloroflexota bacterium]
MTEEKITSNRGGSPKYTWDDTVAAIGRDFSGGVESVADEVIEYTAITRYCEPWEIGNSIYWSEQAAKGLGYRGAVVPWSALRLTFSSGGHWRPGHETRFPTPQRNATADSGRGHSISVSGEEVPMPLYTNSINSGMEIELFEPACVGDRLTVRGDKLVNVIPKQTRVGFGAFHTRQRGIYNQRNELVALVRSTSYSYNAEKKG